VRFEETLLQARTAIERPAALVLAMLLEEEAQAEERLG
jgi:hypothetical protein